MTTRAKTAGKTAAKAGQNIASAAVNHTADTDRLDESTEIPESAESQAISQPERLPLADAKPLLFRLEHGVLFRGEDTPTLQPKIGASCQVGDSAWGRQSKGTQTVWLPAAAWEGMATIIRQTPNWRRQDVAMFLEIVASNLTGPIGGVLIEMVDEVKNDPYRDVPEFDGDAFDYIYD